MSIPREIKFRAWQFHNKEIIAVDCLCKNTVTGMSENGSEITTSAVKLMQFTGLKDKNGVEIYEGDIVDIEHYGIGKVVFYEAMFQYIPLEGLWEIEPGISCTALFPIISEEVEVIGNIYENPELLKNVI